MKTIDISTTAPDEVIAEVRRHKREIAEQFGCDVAALGRALQERQQDDPRFITIEGEQGGADQPATVVDSKAEGTENIRPDSNPRSQ
jgi:hypothetical protein